MSNERTDEFLSWRGRLDQPDALPEQGLDNHEASWQRLAERLRETPRRLTGYWVAAACLLLALIPAIRLIHPRSPAVALRPPVPVTRHTSVRQQALAEKVAAGSLPVADPINARSHLLNTPPAPHSFPLLLPTPRTELPLLSSAVTSASSRTVPPLQSSPVPSNGLFSNGLSPDSIIAPTAPPTINPAAVPVPGIRPATDSHQLMALLPVPKKQLKVVYYNEISNPSGPSPSTAARVPGFLKFSMGRSGSPAAAGDPVEQPDNDHGLIIRLITQNH